MLRSTRSAGGVAAVAAVAMLGGCGGHGREPAPSLPRHAVIRVTPSPSLIDRPVRLTISGLPANGTATLRASWRSYDGPIWSSSKAVAADSGGTVVLAGFGGMRFLWAMTPAAGPQRYF